jgi:3-hydroxyisobutyrate dehydrogenase
MTGHHSEGSGAGEHSPGVTLFIGVGRMGEPMVRRYAVTRSTVLFDVDTDASAGLAAELGTTSLPELTELPADVATVILMLPDSRIVESVLLDADGGDGLFANLSPGTLVIDMGSSEPVSTRRLSELASQQELRYVDAPVSGGVAKATTGELSIMVGGEPEAVESAMEHLGPMGTNIVHVGPSGAGHAAKALNNLLSATNLAAAAEVLCVAQGAGIRPEVMVEVLNSSTGRSQATEVKYPQHILTGSFASGFEMDLMLKDLHIATGLSAEDVSTPITSQTVETVAEARRWLGVSGLDHTEIARYYEGVNRALLRSDTNERPDE